MDVIAAHRHSVGNKAALQADRVCGCFYCGRIFDPGEITDYLIAEDTALCPHCGVDSVIGEDSGFPITQVFLQKMHDHWF